MDMYLASGIQLSLLNGGTQVPLEALMRRYNSYFQKDRPAFPAFLANAVPADAVEHHERLGVGFRSKSQSPPICQLYSGRHSA
jgi:hypothetical protein